VIHLAQGVQKRTTHQKTLLRVWCHKKALGRKTKQNKARLEHPYKVSS
jgi:hypothetical protein